jgi:hypothetical protein
LPDFWIVTGKMQNKDLLLRQGELVRVNIELLGQARQLLTEIDGRAYSERPAVPGLNSAGGHVRHIVEFYECFLDGLVLMHVDYDARQRDLALQSDRLVAVGRIDELIARLRGSTDLLGDSVVFVRMEDAASSGVPEPFLISSIGRELQVLASHTVHHFALVAMAVRAMGWRVGAEFGVARSTLRYQADQMSEMELAAVA